VEPYLYLVLQCDDLRTEPTRFRLADIHRVVLGRGEAVPLLRDDPLGRVLELHLRDRYVSTSHASLLFSDDQWWLIDEGSRNGTLLNGEPVQKVALKHGDLIEVGHTFFLFQYAVASPHNKRWVVDTHQSPPPAPGLETLLPGLEDAFALLAQLARSNSSIQILGDTGTGKEVIARAMHQLSGRPGPFVAVNCGALPPTLVESELFGYRKGAFSGASENRLGWVRSADGGTLMLDEIGDLPLPAQVALLRVLQEHEVVPVGDHRPTPVDLRVCSATHRDLEAYVDGGQFRRDLFTRLQGHRLQLLPLRERLADLGLLTRVLLRRLHGPAADRLRLKPRTFRAMCRHEWPGNIRELEKVLEVALATLPIDSGNELDLPSQVGDPQPAPTREVRAAPVVSDEPLEDDDALRVRVTALLQNHRGNVAAVGRAMGKHPFQIHRWIKRWNLNLEEFRARPAARDPR
jgi:DNA-binding NtrC family response regulator